MSDSDKHRQERPVDRSRRREISDAEARLWAAMTHHIEPLRKGRNRPVRNREVVPFRPRPSDVAKAPQALSPRPVSPRPVSPRPVSPRPVSPRPVSPRPVSRLPASPVSRLPASGASAPKTPCVGELGRRQVRKLGRGRTAIEARLDLHGMCREEAHGALVAFLRRCQTEGKRHVKVITGKGRSGSEEEAESFIDVRERGVLRRAVPHWLSEPALCTLIVGYATAGPGHGGEGALYIQLRRART